MFRILILISFLFSCGSEENYNLDIIGGKNVYRSWYGRIGGCGATLIKPTLAISAAHCFKNNYPKQIIFGLYKRGDPSNGGKPKETILVKRIIKHPSHDLALIKLRSASRFKPKAFANLTPYDGARLKVFGFGNTSYGSGPPTYLQGTVLKFNATATAKSRPQIIRASAPNKGICHGDSGGPLIDSRTGKLIATSTFTVSRCQPGGLMGFTRVDTKWISQNSN